MQKYWINAGHTISPSPAGCDVQLSFVHFTAKTSMPTVLRLDGIYYDTDTDYKQRNAQISDAHKRADMVIYQSKYSRMFIESYLEPRKESAQTSIIYNGIKRGWAGEHINNDIFDIVVSASWRRHKRLSEIIDTFCQFKNVYKEKVILHVLGGLVNNKMIQCPSIWYYGEVKGEDMAKVWRLADASIHLSKKDSCPNTVVEAIGAGSPVVTTNACGGAAEMSAMVKGCKIAFNDGDYFDIKPCKPYTDEYNVLSDECRTNVIKELCNIKEENMRVELPEILQIHNVAEAYLDAMKRVLR
jgi:glycosyltransferase involved in cell wall biosynthesis